VLSQTNLTDAITPFLADSAIDVLFPVARTVAKMAVKATNR
jgi:hypothetical protein